MSPAADSPASPSVPTAECNLQPFFVLHKATPRKPTPKIRRRIDLSPQTSNGSTEECNDNLRLETFKFLWSNTESIIKDVFKNLNANVFHEIDKWVHSSFDAIRACRTLEFTGATHLYPIINSASTISSGASRQIFTALLFTKNMEFVDDITTFTDLGAHLRSHGSFAANLTSSDFSAKNGVGGCLRTLLRQFLMVRIDEPDMSVLASWYAEQESYEKPLVIIIDDVERCYSPVLNDFIVMLREWVVKIPIILVLGVATTIDALRNILSSNTCLYLNACEFNLGTPTERMDAIIEAVLLKSCPSFSIGKLVSTFLRNYFLRHDGTLTLFVKALRIAMVQQVYAEPLRFILRNLADEEGAKGFDEDSRYLREPVVKRAIELPSIQRFCQPSTNHIDWASALHELKRLHKLRSSAVMCLYEVGKYRKINLFDLYCEMLEPEPLNSSASDHMQLEKDGKCLKNGSYVVWASQILRNLSVLELGKLLKRWEMLTKGITEIHEKVKELQSLTTLEKNNPKRDPREEFNHRRHIARNRMIEKPNTTTINEKIASFLLCMVREHIQPIQNLPFHEIVFFDNVDKLQTALIGDPRRRIQVDLLESNKFLKCSCCSKNGSVPVPSMHNTSIMYSLSQEHGDLINLHEWYHSFKAIVSSPPSKAKKKPRLLQSPKKRKDSDEPQNRSDASIQAEFCRAVTELQITGLLRMPSKRRPDYVQRVAFGL